MKSAHKLYETLWVLVFFVIMTALASPCMGASATITTADQGNGWITLTGSATFETCTIEGNSNNRGEVTLKDDPPRGEGVYCSMGGEGSATCTTQLNRAWLQGTNTYQAIATDCTGVDASASTSLTIDNTPTISVTGPSGMVSTPFDITGIATFKPNADPVKGYISIYVDGGLYVNNRECYSENCAFSYQEITGQLCVLPPGGPHTLEVQAMVNYLTASDQKTFYVGDDVPIIPALGRPDPTLDSCPLRTE